MKILVLGISGMLGSMAFKLLSAQPSVEAFGTARSGSIVTWFPGAENRIFTGVEVENDNRIIAVLNQVRPDVVINCIGVIKQLASANDPLTVIPLNSLLPHRLARLCALAGARFVHISTDCVFSGVDGNYTEESFPDAEDLYGRSKLLGEVDYPNAVTLRTSIIGHELSDKHGLLEWFLSNGPRARGFSKAVFSGLTTTELTRVILQHVIPHPEIRGVYHVSVDPISKYDLLSLINAAYGMDTQVQADAGVVVDRSLNSDRFRAATGYLPPRWPKLIDDMQHVGRLKRD